jgi:hypothetical protein
MNPERLACVLVIAASLGCHSSTTTSASTSDASTDAASSPDAGTPVAPAWSQVEDDAGASAALVLGHNAIWSRGGLGLWDDTTHAANPTVAPIVAALHPAALRFPGGTRAMRYHFAQAIGPLASRVPQCDPFTGTTDPTGYGVDEFMTIAESSGAKVTLVAPWVDGSPQEAAAFVAYVNASASSTFAIGVDAGGTDWGTAGSWAQKRATNGHAAPYAVSFVEIGNEPYSSLVTGPATSCGRASPFKQDERWVNGVAIPTTAKDYAAQLALTATLVRGVDSAIQIGAPVPATYDGTSDAATALGDVDQATNDADPWSPRLMSDAASAFDFFVIHPYDFTTSDARLELAEEMRKVIHDLRALAPTKGIGVTEFGFLLDGDTVLDAIVSADVARVALEEGVTLVTRHVLIEDDLTEPFASNALIGGSSDRLSPAYAVEEKLAAIVPGAKRVAVAQPQADVVLLPLVEGDGSLAIVAIDRRDNPTDETDLAVALPSGAWKATIDTFAPSSTLLDTIATVSSTTVTANGALSLRVSANGIVIAHLLQ